MADDNVTGRKAPESIHVEDADTAMAQLKEGARADTVHLDEAMKTIAGYDGPLDWDAAEEKELTRRIDRRLLPLLAVAYALQYYDKALISQAAIFGLRDDLDLMVGNRYPMASSIFYLGYIVGAYPLIFLAQRYRIQRVIPSIIFLWGVTLICAAATHNFQGIYAQRFFLGFLESSIAPTFMLVVGGWYKKDESAFRMGIWFCWTGYITIFTPLVNYALGHIHGSLSPWRYMFILAGSVTSAWAFVVFWFLPGDPTTCGSFLTERQAYIAVARLRTNNTGVRNVHFKPHQLLDAALDPKFWLTVAIMLLMNFSNGPYSTFQAIIVNSLGFSPLTSLLLLLPNGVVTGTLTLAGPYLAYRFKNIRTYIIIFCLSLSMMACLLIWQLPDSAIGGRLFAIYFLGSFGGAMVVLMTLQVANNAGYTKRSFVSGSMFVGYCLGNVAAPLLFKPEDAPAYTQAFTIVVIMVAISIVLTIVYRFVCIWENRRRDRSGVAEDYEHAYEDDITDTKNPQFRYLY